MTKREFNKVIKSVSTKKKLDINKIKNLPDDVKDSVVYFIVRNRGPVVEEFVNKNQISWINSMGYLYKSTSKIDDLTFYHLGTHTIN
jgi:hypothetical protein